MFEKQTVDEQWPDSATAPTQDGDAADGLLPDESRVVVKTTRMGRFLLLKEIGAGGMGTVFAAYDEQLDRKVALKLLRKPRAGSERQRLQVLREARAAARISHPNVVSIYEVNEADGLIHIAMEYVEGETLQKWQTKAVHPWRDILALYLEVGAALSAAHDADVVHRDFKPDNVLIGVDGRPRVVDFGLARVGMEAPDSGGSSGDHSELRAMGRISLAGVIAGTLGYMSPEQYRGGNVDARSDQWSFCASLFEALYGYLPFPGKTIADYSESVYGRPRTRPSGTSVPDEVHRALMRGLSPERDKRFPSMESLLSALSQEHRDDVGSGVGLRRIFGHVAVALSAVLFVLIQIRQWNRPLTYREPIIVSVVLLATALVGGLVRRQALLNHRVHRHAWLLILVALTENFLQRLIAWSADIPRQQMVPFEMVVIAGAMTIGSMVIFRRVYHFALLPLLYGFLVNRALVSPRLGNIVYLCCMFLFFYGWSRAAKEAKAQREAKVGLSARSQRSRSSPSVSSNRTSRPSAP